MPNLLKSRKAQFYIISVVGLITILYALGKGLTTSSIIDTSDLALRNEFFVFNNIVEKTLSTLIATKSCEDLRFNLEEFMTFATREFAPAFRIDYNYTINSCSDSSRSANVYFNITLYSINSQITTSFTRNVNW
jgi:hypothetical protein